MPKAKEYFCWRDCVYGQKSRRRAYKVGEKLMPGLLPGKYFSEDGELPEHVKLKIVMVAGDDPRPTEIIRAELEEEFDVKMSKKASRKELFARYIEEKKKAEAASGDVENAETEKEPENPNIEILVKKFSDMTPDDVDAISSKEAASKIKKDFGVHMKPTKNNKETIVAKGIQMEMGGK